ncbi:putative uncharacterized protein [Clostridium sp. CAG:921]|nr:putative uncharacterized protein [Clostridium sp. CAG:921]
MLRAAILQVEKDEQKTLTDDEIAGVVAKEVKKRRESIADFQKADRQDLVDDLNREIEVLSKYLPKQLTKEEIENLVDDAISITGASSPRDMGKVMQELRPKTTGKADGKIVSEIVKEKLANL